MELVSMEAQEGQEEPEVVGAEQKLIPPPAMRLPTPEAVAVAQVIAMAMLTQRQGMVDQAL